MANDLEMRARQLAEDIANQTANPYEDPLMPVAYAIARALNLPGWPAAEIELQEQRDAALDAATVALSVAALSRTEATGGEATIRGEAPTSAELEEFRRKHWSHWSSSDNLLIAHLVEAMRCREATGGEQDVSHSKAAPGATMFHDAGAIARCADCGRYTLDPRALSDRQPTCACGTKYGWSGSFKPPTAASKWHGPSPSAPASEQAVSDVLETTINKVSAELAEYLPSADAYKGKYVHKSWAGQLLTALAASRKGA